MSQIEMREKELGEGFYFEVIDLEKRSAGKIKREIIFEKLTEKVSEKIFSFIPALSNAIQNNIEKCDNKPEEINCEFAVVIGGKAKFFICELSSQGQFKVNIKWINPKNKKTE